MSDLYLWVGFSVLVLVLLILDLGVFHRSARAVRLREAAAWTTAWVTIAMMFCLVIYLYDRYGKGLVPGAIVEISAPELAGAADAVVTDVVAQPGGEVRQDATLVRLETPDGAIDVPSPVDAEVDKLFVAKGDKVASGAPLARVSQLNRALKFLTGYVIEWSLSMDNVFVFAVIFAYFAVPPHLQHRVLFWGIMGAVIMRLVFILTMAELLDRYHWLIYPMGAFLIFTGLKLMWKREGDADLSHNRVVRFARWLLPVTRDYVEEKFFVRMTREEARGRGSSSNPPATDSPAAGDAGGGRKWLYATPLFLVLLVVESTDVAFAVDSIPAIFAVTQNKLVVFTSNVFAILGLRSLYFLLAGTMDLFRYLSTGLAVILCFVGVKMLLPAFGGPKIHAGVSLSIVCGILVVAIVASLLHARFFTRPAGGGVQLNDPK
jgi:tellurite resistance protein TerC